jgi:two-component system OmpR family response regulator
LNGDIKQLHKDFGAPTGFRRASVAANDDHGKFLQCVAFDIVSPEAGAKKVTMETDLDSRPSAPVSGVPVANVQTARISQPMTTPIPRILMVDDDPGIRDVVSDFLGRHGYQVDTAADGREMEQALAANPIDLVVLDVMLPGEDGLALCRKLAGQEGPAIIMLSAMGEETDRIVGLELGADDYLAKPCSPRELLARVRAVLRRRQEPRPHGERLDAGCEFAGWRLDLVRRELRSPHGVVVNLSSGEFSLLRAFVERPQRVLSRDQLLDLARGPDSDAFDRAIDVQISRLRRKLDDGGDGQELIRTIRSEGYMFTPRVNRAP